MIEEDHLFPLAGIELPVFAQLDRDLREAIRLPCRVQPEHIRLVLSSARDRVRERRRHEEIAQEQQRHERQSGGIARCSAPSTSPRSARAAARTATHHREADHDQNAELHQSLVDVIEHVVPHLVSHHRLDLLERRAIEQVVVERDALRPERAAHVRADPLALLRCIDLPHAVVAMPFCRASRKIGSTTRASASLFGEL